MDIWEAVGSERLSIVDGLKGLSDEQWDSRSLCSEWRIRDVLGHLTAGAASGYRVSSVLGGILRHGLSFNRWMAAEGQKWGSQDPATTLAQLSDAADSRLKPPGAPPVSVLADVVIHGQDMFRPLGIHRAVPENHVRPVTDFMTKATGFGVKKRISGLRLVATDIDWSYGEGPEVNGPVASLVMVMAGRLAALEDLAGPGKSTLASRSR